MRRSPLSMNMYPHRQPTGRGGYHNSGMQVQLHVCHLPQSLLMAMVNMPCQWYSGWGGPYDIVPPYFSIVWGFPSEESWTTGHVWARRSSTSHAVAMRLTYTRKELRRTIGLDYLPIGSWDGTIDCDPDEFLPQRIHLTARPRFYTPAERPVISRKPTILSESAILPSMQLP